MWTTTSGQSLSLTRSRLLNTTSMPPIQGVHDSVLALWPRLAEPQGSLAALDDEDDEEHDDA
jgi:hypothetical protein